MFSIIKDMTDRNHHIEARLYIAEHILRDEELTAIYRDIAETHRAEGHLTRELDDRRHDADNNMLLPRLEAKGLGRYYEAL